MLHNIYFVIFLFLIIWYIPSNFAIYLLFVLYKALYNMLLQELFEYDTANE